MFCSFFSLNTEVNAQDCGTNFNLDKVRRTDPAAYREHLRIEKLTDDYRQRMASNPDPNARLIDPNGIITIPVVFHVINRGEPIGTGTNISVDRVIDQVAVLNMCFGDPDPQLVALIPSEIRRTGSLSAAGFRFVLACQDPNGANTNGIVRRESNVQNFVLEPQNAKKNGLGGSDPWPTDRFLNIWVTPNLFQEDALSSTGLSALFGYSQLPMDYAQKPETDGVVVRFDVVGRNVGNFLGRRQGRTLVHEIGHWLNLRHLYDNGCNNDDGCQDTSPQAVATASNISCPISFPLRTAGFVTCFFSVGQSYWNFMDGTNEECGRLMFSRDQSLRMKAVFQAGGPRQSFVDNYFSLSKLYSTCGLGYYLVKTPFCAANGNISWSITGPATTSGYPSTFATVYPQAGANGIATLTASWNNMTTDFTIPVGYGLESSTYNPNYYNSGNTPTTTGSVNMTSYNNWTYGQVSFTGATGPAKNWRLASCNSCNPNTYISWNGNNFGVYLTQPYAFATIRAEIPAACGDITIEYSFLGGYLNPGYMISPNPANNEITISASMPIDPNNRTSNSSTPAYEVQIFNAFNQLLKKTKVKKDDRDVTIDVSRFPSNQFYTVKLISANDVQTKSFFKQ